MRYVCIHGHFYQPPRENPWLEAIELQTSAAPYHDWNERICDECYAPNASARLLDESGWLRGVANNYAKMSFNFGPTLLSWLETHAHETHAAIVDADRRSIGRFGRGSAMAQSYNHLIMPLANDRDRRTQVRWGIADFRHRFHRQPEGMWLAEAAVDTPTLEALAAEGIRFTVLAPRQAARFRATSSAAWTECNAEPIDPSRPYLCRLPSGATITLFFYDGPVSQAVAFEGLLNDGRSLAARMLDAFSPARKFSQLAHIATDGESYGHHHRHGEMALASALESLDARPDVELTNYASFLEREPPVAEAQIHENSSWSCVHGVERWRADCGCASGMHPGWHQKWRAPLREALDDLRDKLAASFEQQAADLFEDPWAAREAYIAVILSRSEASIDAFFEAHARRELSGQDRVRGLKLLEAQRHAMLMYTSCGWFFDDIAGIETVQVMLYAARAMQLERDCSGTDHEPAFLEQLRSAPGNREHLADGGRTYDALVRPMIVDLPRVAAHVAVGSLFAGGDADDAPGVDAYCYDAEVLDEHRHAAGRTRLHIGRVRLTSRITREDASLQYAVLHAGDHIIHGGAVLGDDAEALGAVNDSLAEAFDEGDLVRIVREMERAFGGSAFSLGSLFHDEQVRFAETIAFSAISSAEMTYKRLYGEHQPLVRFLAGLALPVPRALRLPAEFVVNRAIEDELSQDAPSPQRLRKLYDTAHREGVALDEGHTYRLGGMLEKLAFQTLGDEHKHEKLESLIGAIDLVGRVAPSLQPHAAQLAVFRAFGGASGDDERAHELRKRAADALRVRLPSA